MIRNDKGEWVHERVYGFVAETIFTDESYTRQKPDHIIDIMYQNQIISKMLLYENILESKSVDGVEFSKFVNSLGPYLHHLIEHISRSPKIFKDPQHYKERIADQILLSKNSHNSFSLIIVEMQLSILPHDKEYNKFINELTNELKKKIRGQDEIIYYDDRFVAFILPDTDEHGRLYIESRIKGIIDHYAKEYMDGTESNMGGATYPYDGFTPIDLLRKIDGRMGFNPRKLIPKITINKPR